MTWWSGKGGFIDTIDEGLKSFDKAVISGDYSKRQKERQKQEQGIKDAEAAQESYINQQQRKGTDYFRGERSRNIERSDIDQRYYDQTAGTLDQWQQGRTDAENKYLTDLDRARGVEDANMRRADETYTTMNPLYRDAMDSAVQNSKSAMTLQEYMDPNNRVASGVRDLYNKEGEASFQRYETQAQNEGRQGLANYGIMSSLGAQSAANAMGNMGPMTVGQQMSQLAVANQAAAEGYANTQRRLQELRDQGLSNREALRQLGIDQGFARTDKAYDRGRESIQDALARMGDYESFQDRDISRRGGISDRISGIEGQRRTSESSIADILQAATQSKTDLRRDIDMDKLARETGLSGEELAYMNAIIDKRMGREDINLENLLGLSQGRLADVAASDANKQAFAKSIMELIAKGASAATKQGATGAGGES